MRKRHLTIVAMALGMLSLTVAKPDSGDWTLVREDAEIGYVPEPSRYVLLCNMRDLDGTPGNSGRFPTLDENETRVMGTFYSRQQIPTGEVH